MPQHRLTLGWIVFAGCALTAAAAQAAEVRLDLRGLERVPAGELVVLGAEPTGGEVVRPLRAVLAAPAGSTVTCRGEGLWCPELRVTEDHLTLPVFPTTTVTGRVVGRAALRAPVTARVQGVVRTASEGATLELRTEVSLEDDGTFAFPVPRADLDLRFAFPGAAPVYLWAIAPPAEEDPATVRLGSLTLHPGASLIGWAARREDDLPVPRASVVASPMRSGDEPRMPLHTWRGVADERGFFQLHGLSAGTYRLELTAEGRVPRVLEAVEVSPGAETIVGTVALPSPLRLSVAIQPPRHPDGARWMVELSPVRRLPDEEPVRVEASEEGIAEVDSLRPAEYYVRVQGPGGDNLHFERHEVVGDEWLSLEVPVVQVAGTVRLGGEPIAADVVLEGGDGDRVELASDEMGRLTGWMRRPHRPWLMATVAWTEAEARRQRLLEVVPSVEDETIELAIDLPAGVLHGEVVDAEGRPQRGVRVIATPAERASRFTRVRGRTDLQGRFHLTGLDSTRYQLQAGGNGGPASEVVTVDLSADVPAGDVRLVVWPTRELEVRVLADHEPVPGAEVSLGAFGRHPVALAATTDPGGGATFEVPESVERAVVTVFAPSRSLWSGCLALGDEPLVLALPIGGAGTLSLRLLGRNDLPPILGGRNVLLTGDGGFVDYGTLVHWNRSLQAERALETDGAEVVESLAIPALAPGRYALTWTGAPEWELAAVACAGGFSGLGWVTLSPGGEARLSLDGREAQARRLETLTEAAPSP